MIHKPKAITGKVVTGYLLLFATAVLAVWFVYTEILKTAVPDENIGQESRKVIDISDAVTRLYAAETVGRNALLKSSESEFASYNKMIDSVTLQFEGLKTGIDGNQLLKLDTIQQLLASKRESMREIMDFRKAYTVDNTFNKAVRKISKVKDSLNKTVKPVAFKNDTQLRQFLNRVLTPRQQDSLSRLPVSNERLTAEIEKMLNKLILRDNRVKYNLFLKEQKLQDESRVISDKIRVIVGSLQNDIVTESYAKIDRSKQTVAATTKKVAWIGAIAFFIFVLIVWLGIRDISISQRYRQRLEILNLEKEDLLRSKTMLLATVTHDIQTPLGSVIGFTDLLRSTHLDKKQLQYTDNIRNSSEYIVRLVNDLIDFSKLENDRISIQKVPFNLKELIENCCLSLEPNATNKKIALRWQIDHEIDNYFLSDPYRIKQVLTNLISNAIKFTQKGSVIVMAKAYENTLEIAVADTGIGIAKASQQSVFKEFTQAHSGIEKKFGGTGLGLTIAKRMLGLLGGSIKLESEEGKGSTFTVTLPKEPVAMETSEPIIQKSNLYPTLRGKKILVVDDDAMQLTLMRELFQQYPVEIRTESNAVNVPGILSEEFFDLVITDVQMPDIDGFELVRRLRSNSDPALSQIPVLALSGKRDLTVEDFTSRGFTAVHPKPLDLPVLLKQIGDLLGVETSLDIPLKVSVADNPDVLYSLETLNHFTQKDKESLRIILNTFVESSRLNCNELSEAASYYDLNKLSALAHKMSPMLKQLEANSIVQLLEPLEHKKIEMNKTQLKRYVLVICKKMEALFEGLLVELD
ncbi:hybrid sensor histidine kinase/response regulator [Flavobacterium silvaticum]|uniref:histidine kinase n=1 Tax=Flavobacterium silvaticum TaxID=1852020 RepID=A0A972JJR0_9FLAO|nr:ATP-binding protein [Flavobacterium silvaticum]NMH29653.1 response regulator [Flavobacterium silvaticum]